MVHDHGEERKYKCDYCPAKFIQRIHLNRHTKTFHTELNSTNKQPSIRMRSANSRPPMKEWQRGTATKTAPKSTNKKQASSRKSRVVTTIIAGNENMTESGPPSIAGSAMTDNVTGRSFIKYHFQNFFVLISQIQLKTH